jgi:plasmid stability protein
MPTITLKNIPDSLYTQLKVAAGIHRRSLNSEILYCVERTLGTHKINASEHIQEARKLREKTAQYHITDQELTDAKNAGRP